VRQKKTETRDKQHKIIKEEKIT